MRSRASGSTTARSCALVYLWPQIDDDEVRELFERLYTEGEGSVPELATYYDFTYSDAPDNPLVQVYERWLDALERERPPGRLLDIGCGTGLFLAVARRRGWQPYGVDDCARRDRARARPLRARGLGRTVHRLRGARGPALRRDHDVGHHRARARAGRPARGRARRARAGRRDRASPRRTSAASSTSSRACSTAARAAGSRGRSRSSTSSSTSSTSARDTLRGALDRASLAAVRLERELTELRRLSLSRAERLVLEALFLAARADRPREPAVRDRARALIAELRARDLAVSCAASCARWSSCPPTTRRRTCSRSRADVLAQDAQLDVLVVDDNSPDGTGDLVEAAQRDEPRLHLLRRAGKLGLGTAYLAGFRHALEHGYDRVLTMDCDYSHHPRYLPHMLEVAAEADLVIGSRYVAGRRRGQLAAAPPRCSRASRTSTRACCCASPCATAPRASAATAAPCSRRSTRSTVRASGYSFLEEMVWRVHHAGFSIREIPIVFEDRRARRLEDRSGRDLPRRAPRAGHRVPPAARAVAPCAGSHVAAQIDRRSSSSTTG